MRIDVRFGRTISIEFEDQFGNKEYSFNGTTVSKREYDSLERLKKKNDVGDCKPCYLMEYDNGVLVHEGKSYMDCPFGILKDYLSNGVLNSIGYYKEFPYWDTVKFVTKKYCGVRDGEWIYFNESGDTLYREFWKEGDFLYQKPEQDIAEIWRTDFMIDDTLLKIESIIPISDFKKIIITPRFKNSSRKNLNLYCIIETFDSMRKIIKAKVYLNDLNLVDLDAMLKAGGYSKEEDASIKISVYNDKKFIKYFSLKLRR